MAETRRRPTTLGQTIGGVLVGFDEQVWSTRPPAQERVEQVDRVRTVVAAIGLTIELPLADGADAGDVRPAAAADEAAAPDGEPGERPA